MIFVRDKMSSKLWSVAGEKLRFYHFMVSSCPPLNKSSACNLLTAMSTITTFTAQAFLRNLNAESTSLIDNLKNILGPFLGSLAIFEIYRVRRENLYTMII